VNEVDGTQTTIAANRPGKSHRRCLPATRNSITHKFSINSHEGYLTVGVHDDGSPGEIFIKMSKEGSTLSGLIQAYCRAFSLAIQYGLTLEEAILRFKNMRFEPMGMTTNPDIPYAKSIIDYTARYLETYFLRREETSADQPKFAEKQTTGAIGLE